MFTAITCYRRASPEVSPTLVIRRNSTYLSSTTVYVDNEKVRISHSPITIKASLRGQLKCIQACPSFNNASSHLLPQRARVRACSHSRVAVVCVYERALHERIVCVRAVSVFSRACVRVDVSCVRGRLVCAFMSVRCIDGSCACAVTSRVRAQPSCVCVHERACASTSTSRVHRVRVVACVRVDVSCACHLFVVGSRAL